MSNFMSDLDKWILESVEKRSAEEPTSHPSQGVDDGNKPAATGTRASENESDVKTEVPGESVDTATGEDAEGAGRGENTPSNSIGTQAAATGEDPSVETASVKAKPEDPGTTHPAKATMGEKYSAAQLSTMADAILADIAVATAVKSVKSAQVENKVAVKAEVKAEDTSAAKSASVKDDAVEKAASADELTTAKEAGRQAAAAVVSELSGSAATSDVSPADVIDSVIKQAAADAVNSAEFLAGFLSKRAMDASDTGDMVMEETADVPEAGIDDAGMGAEDAMAAAPAEGGDIEAVVEALVNAGVTPEELIELATEGAEGDGGAGIPEEAGMPVDEAAAGLPPEAGMDEAMLAAAAPKMASAKAWKNKSTAEKCAALKATIATMVMQDAASVAKPTGRK